MHPGLIRSGVAPDHPEVKSVVNDFESVGSNPRLSFLGNVCIGRDIGIADLTTRYNAVLLAYGAAVRAPARCTVVVIDTLVYTDMLIVVLQPSYPLVCFLVQSETP